MRCLPTLSALCLLSTCACSAPDELPDVAYDDRFGEATTMDVYLPASSSEPRPAILMIHGGAWRLGSKDAYREAARRMARSGWVAVSINYRLGPEGVYPLAVQDCVCALSFLRSKASEWNLDPVRVAVTGYSAGGHLASLLGVAADATQHVPDCEAGATAAPNAVISAAGPQDFRGKDHEVLREFLGGSERDVPRNYATASPLQHVAAGQPPLLLLSGGADWFIDTGDLERMRDAMTEAGNDAALLFINGGGHLINVDENVGAINAEVSDMTPEAWTASSDFLARTLGWP